MFAWSIALISLQSADATLPALTAPLAMTAQSQPMAAAPTAPPQHEPALGMVDVEDFAELDLGKLLDAEVITGSGFRRKLSELPAVVEVLTADDIRRLGIRDLNQLLRKLAATYVMSSGIETLIAQETQIGGGGVADDILVIIDNHPMADELAEAYAPYSIPIESIERAEFLRGPAAVLYGSSAMSGVLRIVTKRGFQPGVGAAASVAPWNKGGDVAAHGTYGNGDDIGLRVDLQARQTPLSKLGIPVDGGGASGQFPLQSTYMTSLVTVHWGSWYARLQNHVLQRRVIGLQTMLAFATQESGYQLHSGEIGFSKRVGDWNWSARTALDYHKRSMDIGRFPPFPLAGRSGEQLRTIFDFDGVVAEVAGESTYQAANWNWLSGVQYRYLAATSFGFTFKNDGKEHVLFPPKGITPEFHDANIFMQGGYSPISTLDVLAGLRGNYLKRSVTGFDALTSGEADPPGISSPMGRGAIVYKPVEEASFKLLYGRAFRLPTMINSYASVKTAIEPSPLLNPEILDTAEIAGDLKPLRSVFVRMHGFRSWIKQSIEFTLLGTGKPSRYLNSKLRYSNQGVVGGVQWIPSGLLNLSGNITFQHAEWEDGEPLPQPNVIAKAAATFTPLENRAELTPYLNYQGKFYDVQPATWYDLYGRVRMLSEVWATLSAENIFDRKLYRPFYAGRGATQVDAFVAHGRAIQFGLSAEF